jgi:hypothetical protein
MLMAVSLSAAAADATSVNGPGQKRSQRARNMAASVLGGSSSPAEGEEEGDAVAFHNS